MAKYSRVKQSGDVTNFTSTAELPLSGLRRGETAFANNSLYISNGSGWYRITLVNESPSITLDSDGVSLGSSGNTVTVGYTVVEPEGTPVNVTAASTANSSQANFTINSSNNSLTIENLSAEGFSANVTLTATDGVNIGTDSLVLNVIYLSELWDETVLSIGTSSTNSLDNSTFIDRSTNVHTVTPTGSPVQTAFHPYLDNWSVEFDGTNDYFTIANSSEQFVPEAGDFTFETWFYTPDSTRQDIYSSYTSTSGFGVAISYAAVGDILVYKGNTLALQTTGGKWGINQWNHLVVSRSGTSLKVFINGVEVGSTTDSTDFSGTSTLYIGRAGNSTLPFEGFLSNLRLVKGTALYTSNFTPPTENLTAVSGTSLLTCQSNRFIDNSASAHSITVNGNPEISAFNPFGQGSEYAVGENKGSILLNGTNNYLSLPSSSLYNFTGDFTIEAWVYINGNSPLDNGNTRTAIIVNTQQNSNGIAFQIGGNSSTTGINLNVEIRSGTNIGYAATATIPQRSWNHCVVVRSSGTLTFYLNGVNIGTSAVSTNIPAGALTVGYMGNTGYPRYLNGLISDIRIVNGTAVYTSNFTPPTSPVGNTNADLYLPMDNAGIFDKTGNHTLTPVDNTSTSTTQTKFADTAMYFDGTGDYITEEASTSYGYGTSDFTIEFWMYLVGTSTRTVFSNLSSASGTQPHLYTNGTDLRFYTAGGDRIASGSLNANQWYHVSLCKGSSNTRLFIDGTQVGSTYADTNNYGSSAPLGIGTYHNPTPVTTSTMSGYLENLQILKGVAKYTANFTPPTSTQGQVYQAGS